jgi:hypothetical protein
MNHAIVNEFNKKMGRGYMAIKLYVMDKQWDVKSNQFEQ